MFIISIFFLLSLSTFDATLLRVSDGDTIVVQTQDYEQVKVRLYGIDAPERDQLHGSEATDFLTPFQGQPLTMPSSRPATLGTTLSIAT
jgi:hypothetical protein